MKKVLLIMLLTFTSLANASEGRYTMVADAKIGVFILDTKDGSVRYCTGNTYTETIIKCSKSNEDKD